VAVVVEEFVACAAEAEGAGHDLELVLIGGGAAGGEDIVDRPLNIIRDIEVQVSITVGVEEGAASAPGGIGDAGFLRDLLEGAVAAVVIEAVGPKQVT